MSSIRKLVIAAAVAALGVAASTASAQAAQSAGDPYARPQADGIISVLIAGVTDGTSNTIFTSRATTPAGIPATRRRLGQEALRNPVGAGSAASGLGGRSAVGVSAL